MIKMPLKFRLRKTRNYNVLSRNVFVLSVELIDKTTLECTLSSDSSGLDCLHNVCQRLGLQQPEFFGLRYMSKRPYPKVRWVELERPLKRQLDKYAQSPALTLAVMYYIHDVGLLQDDVTRSQYFLQVKYDVLEGRVRATYDQAVLLASYSLQAEFGDHQRERHTPEYLKDFKLFPAQVIKEGEVSTLLEAVVWQYSSLKGLGQALAETYYILEAQRLSGYGQETFMARDEKGCEVYLGASLLGLAVNSASGDSQTFYKWKDIKNLINHKRSVGVECARNDLNAQFSFDEPDAAKYVWKMCVKQHTFYKGNEEVLDEVGAGGFETRSLAIPDLQSSVMASYKGTHIINPSSSHEITASSQLIKDSLHDDINSRTFTSSMPHLDLSYIPKSADVTNQSSVLDSSSQLTSHDSFSIVRPSGLSFNASRLSTRQGVHPHLTQTPLQPHYGPSKQDVSNLHYIYSSDLNSSFRHSGRRALLPQYRPAPDYETALLQKYGPGINSRLPTTVLYSSQPEISTQKKDSGIRDKEEGGLKPSTYSQYGVYTDLRAAYPEHTPQQQRINPMVLTGTLHNTYSTPELAQTSTEGGVEDLLDYHFIHGFKPPPPYPYSKPSSNSTPDLASASKCEEASIEPYGSKKRLSLLTSSLGCLGSPELSRTYENLSELTDAVESLRLELTKGESSFLHSFAPNYSTDNLDAIYQLSNGRVAALEQNSGLKNLAPSASFNGYIPSNTGSSSEEPIYQNVGTVLSDIKPDRRGRAKSAPELDAEDSQKSEEALLRSSYESAGPGTGIQFLAKFNNSQNHAFAIHQLQTQPQHSVQTQAQQQKVVTQSQQIQQNSSQHQEKALQQQQHVFNTALSQNQSLLISQSQQQLLQAHRQQQQQQQQFLQNQTHQQSQKQLHQQQAKSNFSQQHLAQAQQHPSQPQLQLQQPPSLSKAKIQLQSSQQVPQQQFQNISSQHSTSTHTMAQQQLQHPVQHLPQTHMNSQQNLINSISSQTKDYHSPARKGRKSVICSEDSKKVSTVAFPLKDNGAKPDLLMESFSSYSNKDPKAIELEEKIASMDIVREYESIPRIKNNPDFTSALRSENVPRNRYKDIVPYEENRVKITPSKDNKAGYVNASHITASVGDTQRFYICAQGPLPTTVAHFWQCVWETDVRLLVMLAAVEGDTNTSKSFPYWPQIDNTSVECDQFRIYRKHSTKSGFHVTSRLQLVQMSQRKSRSVWHLQFTDWADHGCPEDVHSFLSFLEELATLRRLTFEEIDGIGKNRNTPVLVHCSAGVGRSGVTILCDLLMEAAKHNLPLNPPKILTQLRQQRMALVQSFNQYKFVYKVLLASLQNARLI